MSPEYRSNGPSRTRVGTGYGGGARSFRQERAGAGEREWWRSSARSHGAHPHAVAVAAALLERPRRQASPAQGVRPRPQARLQRSSLAASLLTPCARASSLGFIPPHSLPLPLLSAGSGSHCVPTASLGWIAIEIIISSRCCSVRISSFSCFFGV